MEGSKTKVAKKTYGREKTHVCVVVGCGKRYDRPAKLLDHMRVHTGEKPYECNQCSAAFARKKDLTAHVLTHVDSEMKPLHCPKCGKGVNTRQHLRQHMRTHDPPGNHVCSICGRKFSRQGFLKRHMSRHTFCDQCQRPFTGLGQLQDHIRRHHTLRYHCGVVGCTAMLASWADLNAHLDEHRREWAEKGPPEQPMKQTSPQNTSPGVSYSSADAQSYALGKSHDSPTKSDPNHPSEENDRELESTEPELAPTLARLTGKDYELRPIGCPVENCPYRFKRRYDLQRHVSTMHSFTALISP